MPAEAPPHSQTTEGDAMTLDRFLLFACVVLLFAIARTLERWYHAWLDLHGEDIEDRHQARIDRINNRV